MSERAPDDDSNHAFFAAFMVECERLQLHWDDLPPSFAFGFDDADGLDGFLDAMRALTPGVTWRDVFPGMPDDLEDGTASRP